MTPGGGAARHRIIMKPASIRSERERSQSWSWLSIEICVAHWEASFVCVNHCERRRRHCFPRSIGTTLEWHHIIILWLRNDNKPKWWHTMMMKKRLHPSFFSYHYQDIRLGASSSSSQFIVVKPYTLLLLFFSFFFHGSLSLQVITHGLPVAHHQARTGFTKKCRLNEWPWQKNSRGLGEGKKFFSSKTPKTNPIMLMMLMMMIVVVVVPRLDLDSNFGASFFFSKLSLCNMTLMMIIIMILRCNGWAAHTHTHKWCMTIEHCSSSILSSKVAM